MGLWGCGHPSACCCCDSNLLTLVCAMLPATSAGATIPLPWVLLLAAALLGATPIPDPLWLPPRPSNGPMLSPLLLPAAVHPAVRPACPPSKPCAIESPSAAALCCSLRWLKLVALSPKVPARCRARPGDPMGLWCDCDWPGPVGQQQTLRCETLEYSAVQVMLSRARCVEMARVVREGGGRMGTLRGVS